MSATRGNTETRLGNQRLSSTRQRKRQHLLDVTVRSRKAAQQRTRKIVSFLCKTILFVALAGGTCYGVREGARRLFWENPDYVLSQISVISDGALTRNQILGAAAIREGCNILTVNLSKLRERLSTLPQVEHVELQRIMPHKISIAITERKPIAWLAAKGDEDPSASADSYLIDRGGTLISTKVQLPEYLYLPVIYGISTENCRAGDVMDDYRVRAALDLINLSANAPIQTRFQVRAIDLSKGYCMLVTDQTRAHITFGFERIEWQLDRLGMVMDRVDESKKELQTVNLMLQRNVPVTFADTAQAPAETPGKAQPEPAGLKPASSAKASPARIHKTGVEIRRAQAVTDGNGTNKASINKAREKAPPLIRQAIPADTQQTIKTNGQG